MAKKKPKTEAIVGNLDPTYWVQKSDPLVLMRSVPFSLGELKILDTYISRINADDDTRRTVIFTKEEYEELMGLTAANYRALEKHTKGMLGKVVELEMPNEEYLQFVLFEQARYRKDEYGKPIVELTCTTTAKDLFFCINKYHFFSYALENVIKLTRKASYLLYIYVRYNRYRGKWEIDLDELRDTVLDCRGQESYQAFKEFKRAVLDPAVKEINKKTDCHFEYETVKRGRKVAKIKFIYQSQDQLDGQTSLFDVTPANTDEQQDYGSTELNAYAAVCGNNFTADELKMIEAALDMHTAALPTLDERVNWLRTLYAKLTIEELDKTRKPIKNRIKYFVGMIQKSKPPKKEEQHEPSYNMGEWEGMALSFDPSMVKKEDD